MTILHVTIESSFTGPGGGFQQIVIDDRLCIHELIKQYCTAKGIPVNPNYAIINRSNLMLHGNKTLSYYAVKDNESLVLGTTADDSRTYRFGHWFTLAGLGFLFGLLGITICVILFAVIRIVPDNYAIVVDAGSTHSDVILYKWPGVKVNNTGEVLQVSTCYITGGIAQITSKNVSSYFEPCFNSAEKEIPAESQTTVEVLFGATAGMRLLNSSDSAKANERIASVKQYLRTTDLIVKESNVGVITGAVEGISGWITINFLKDTIYSKVKNLNSSWGALDLGGASTQLTFEVSGNVQNNPKIRKLQLFGHKFNVFSQSFLCYGVVQATLRYRALLLENHWKLNKSELIVNSPCDPKGRRVTLTDLDFQTPCLKSNSSLNSKILATGHNYVFLGTGNFDECGVYIKDLLYTKNCQKAGWQDCIDPSLIPASVTETKFMGFASFAYVANALLINKTTTQHDFLYRTKVLCALSYETVLEMKTGEKSSSYRDLENSCFKAQFVYTLLSDVYGFNTDEKWEKVKFTSKVNGASLGWSLGYMINATETISAGPSVPTLRTVPFALLLVLFAMFLIISIGFVFHGIKLRKSASYQRKIATQMDEEIIKFIVPQQKKW